jgi:hypothetical protein
MAMTRTRRLIERNVRSHDGGRLARRKQEAGVARESKRMRLSLVGGARPQPEPRVSRWRENFLRHAHWRGGQHRSTNHPNSVQLCTTTTHTSKGSESDGPLGR